MITTTKLKMMVTSGGGEKGVVLETSKLRAIPFFWCVVITYLYYILCILHIFYKYFVSVLYLK